MTFSGVLKGEGAQGPFELVNCCKLKVDKNCVVTLRSQKVLEITDGRAVLN